MTTATLGRSPVTESVAPSAVSTRREALTAMDATVRPLLERRLVPVLGFSLTLPSVDLTVYDVVYPAVAMAGGHWMVTARQPWLLSQRFATFTVVLEFDEQQRPARFRISGATDVTSDDATPEALDRALARAAAAGPKVSWTPMVMPGFSL